MRQNHALLKLCVKCDPLVLDKTCEINILYIIGVVEL